MISIFESQIPGTNTASMFWVSSEKSMENHLIWIWANISSFEKRATLSADNFEAYLLLSQTTSQSR